MPRGKRKVKEVAIEPGASNEVSPDVLPVATSEVSGKAEVTSVVEVVSVEPELPEGAVYLKRFLERYNMKPMDICARFDENEELGLTPGYLNLILTGQRFITPTLKKIISNWDKMRSIRSGVEPL